MKRLAFVAAFLAAFFISPCFAQTVRTDAPMATVTYGMKDQTTYPDLPLIHGNPPLFGAIASGTGTSTQYLKIKPVAVNATTGAVLVEGAISLITGTSTATSILTASTGTQSVVLLSSVAQAITPLANRKYIALIASGPFEYTVGSTTLMTGNSSVYSTSFEANAAVPIGVSCSGVPVNLTVRQWGN